MYNQWVSYYRWKVDPYYIKNNLTATEIINSAINENDVEVCSICLEEWTNSGQHRLVSTQCGHLFGKMYKNNTLIFVLN
jgi:hypothetical protein